jgi:hypothetical protein
MAMPNENAELADRFGEVAGRFCSLVDSSKNCNRNEFASQIYQILPKLIDQAIGLPDVKSSGNHEAKVRQKVEEWGWLYKSLKERFGEWDLYRQVFDPTRDSEAIRGSLADDIADIYRDLKEGLVLKETCRSGPEDLIWQWRLSFYSHWGKHAIDALLAIHFQLQNSAVF